jgi:hypothetical protein
MKMLLQKVLLVLSSCHSFLSITNLILASFWVLLISSS